MDRWEDLDRQLFRALVDGKIGFTSYAEIKGLTRVEFMNKNLNRAIELEEYEAAQIIKDKIDEYEKL